jgi:ABC-type lipoprotein export system ATPase subunit
VLQSVDILDYRSCTSTSFTPHPHLSVLIGPNGSGKTNVLHAIHLLRHLLADPDYYVPDHEEDSPGAHSRIKVVFSYDTLRVILFLDFNTYAAGRGNQDRIAISRQSWCFPQLLGARRRFNIPLGVIPRSSKRFLLARRKLLHSRHGLVWRQDFPELPKTAWRALQGIRSFLAGLQYYSASQFTNPSRCPVSFQIEGGRIRTPLSHRGPHEAFLVDLYREFKQQDTTHYQQFLDLIGPPGLRMLDRIGFREIRTSTIEHSVRIGGKIKTIRNSRVLVVPQFTIGRHTLSPSQLSEGTFRTMTLLFYLITRSSSLLLLEEPEVCVHHGLLSSIMELLKSYSAQRQVMISTHSDFVLDHVEPENVFKVSFSRQKGTQVHNVRRSLSQREFSALRDYLKSEGNLGEYWRSGGLD